MARRAIGLVLRLDRQSSANAGNWDELCMYRQIRGYSFYLAFPFCQNLGGYAKVGLWRPTMGFAFSCHAFRRLPDCQQGRRLAFSTPQRQPGAHQQCGQRDAGNSSQWGGVLQVKGLPRGVLVSNVKRKQLERPGGGGALLPRSETDVYAASQRKRVEGATTTSREDQAQMTKAALVEEVSRVVEMGRNDSEAIVEAIFDSMVRALRSGERIEIRGFGSLSTRQRKPRVGRNPKTGARVEVPARRIAHFKASKALKDLVNNSAKPEPASAPPSS
jgi:integration host factor subunit beta